MDGWMGSPLGRAGGSLLADAPAVEPIGVIGRDPAAGYWPNWLRRR